MKEPKIGKTYTFVRRRGDAFEHTDFTRHKDGSGGFLADGHYSIFECHADAWQQALAALAERGFVELTEARESGVIPAEWQPTPENSTLHECSRPVTVVPIPDDPSSAPMTQRHQPSREGMKRLVECGLEATTYIPLREALTPHLIEPYVRMLVWPYSKPQVEFPCWIIADLSFHQSGLTLAYCPCGHGSHGDPWGVVLASDTSFGRDDSWFTCLEDAFINSGAWKRPLPPEYEIR